MKKFVFILFSIILVIGAWFYSDLWLSYQAEQEQIGLLQQDILNLEEEHNGVLAQLVEEEAKTAQLREEIASLNAELTEALKPELMSLIHKDPDAGRRFIPEETPMWFLPGEDQASLGAIEAGTLVRIIEETHSNVDNKDYFYVETVNYAEPENNRGYIRKEAAVYFTPDLETQVMNPLTLPAGTVVYEDMGDGEQEAVLTEELTVYKIGVEEGMARVGTFGGRTFRTDVVNIQYPKSSIEYTVVE